MESQRSQHAGRAGHRVIAWPAEGSKPGTPAYQARLFGRRVESAVESSSKD